MRVRRRLLLVAMLGAAFLLLFAVGNVFDPNSSTSDPSPNRHPDEPLPEPQAGIKEITVQAAMDVEEFAVLSSLSRQYQALHGDTSLKLERVEPEAAYALWKKAAQLGEPPDVLLLDNRWVTEFAALGFLTPVDSLLTSDQLSQHLQPIVNQVKWNGYMWGVPKDLDVPVLAYSTKRLKELGADKPPIQSEDLLALLTASDKLNDGKRGLDADLADPNALFTLLRTFGGAKTQGKGRLVKLTDPAELKTLETLFPEAGVPSPSSRSGNASKRWEQLVSGQTLGLVTTLSEYKKHAADTVALSALPLPKGESIWKSSWLTGRSFAITSSAKYQKEAFDWIREMTTAAAGIKFWNEVHALPTVMNSYGVGGIRSDAAVMTVNAYLERDEGLPVSPVYNRQLQQLEEQLRKRRSGELSWKTALEAAEQAWEKGEPGANAGTAAANTVPGANAGPAASTGPTASPAPAGTPK